METISNTLSSARLPRFLFMSFVAVLLCSEPGHAQFVFSGLPIESKKFHFLVSEYGYSDSFLDQHWGFKGREYLSGEWAAALYYEGGHLSPMARWLTPMFVFPDFVTTGPHFGVKMSFHFALNPTNAYGFPVFQSIITNADIEITMTYDIVDVGTNQTDQVAIGLIPASVGGSGSNIWSGRYVYRQAYEIANISGQILSNIRFHQFLHALQSTWAVYDNRDYGGAMPYYHHAITQQGKSYALHSRSKKTYEVTDTLSFLSHTMPAMVEVGLFGASNTDSHLTNKPSLGTHLSVEANSLNNNDQVYTNKDAWVSGAMSFNFGTLAPGAMTNIDFLIAVNSVFTEVYPPVNIVIHSAHLSGGNFIIDFEETTGNPLVGFSLRSTDQLDDMKVRDWNILPYPYFINVPIPGRNRYTIPFDPMAPRRFFVVDPVIF